MIDRYSPPVTAWFCLACGLVAVWAAVAGGPSVPSRKAAKGPPLPSIVEPGVAGRLNVPTPVTGSQAGGTVPSSLLSTRETAPGAVGLVSAPLPSDPFQATAIRGLTTPQEPDIIATSWHGRRSLFVRMPLTANDSFWPHRTAQTPALPGDVKRYSSGAFLFLEGWSLVVKYGADNPNWRGGGPIVRCDQCGKLYEQERWHRGIRSFCSRSCADMARRKPRLKMCDACGNIVQDRRSRSYLNAYCSRTCYTKAKSLAIDRQAVVCYYREGHSLDATGDHFGCSATTVSHILRVQGESRRSPAGMRPIPRMATDAGVLRDLYIRERLSAAAIAKHFGCSTSAIRTYLSKHNIPRRDPAQLAKQRIGPLSRTWKGGITPHKTAWGRSREGRRWKATVHQRDGYQCQVCGLHSQNVAAHHILSYADYPELAVEISNGLTVCHRPCHGYLHSKKGATLNAILRDRMFAEFGLSSAGVTG
jgi:5-methylcytosine-specific restriction endonuclease McrA